MLYNMASGSVIFAIGNLVDRAQQFIIFPWLALEVISLEMTLPVTLTQFDKFDYVSHHTQSQLPAKAAGQHAILQICFAD